MIHKLTEAAEIAADIIRNGFKKNVNIEFKTNESNIVTETDKKSEAEIINYIRKNFPTHNIITEESGEHLSSSEYTWVIDPLDGTTNFAHKLPIFAVSIGLLKRKETIAGVVLDVMREIIYSAEAGSGAYANDRKLSVNENDNLRRSVLVTGFPYDINDNPYNAIEIFTTMLKKTRAIRRLGSAAIDFCYTAEGVFDGFWEVHLHPWDIAAGKLIVEEAGGIVTDFAGNKIDVFSKQILASNGKIHKPLSEIINSVVRK
ncbi:MAG TPA: inositol monophosphatase family protein [Ignavibacteriaceae bacterium]|jgi:myo-inositol-1(or 4)-monophosphatase|nr:inositol monophosphatase family protein [Ignavibacteriaceae bacterium]HOJ17747.1 inositol monophosphatase family protein [Ignavibacteriaceae bacterium]HPO56430.1 inositol monophosphatase family protein [Ignavibacteriaceae bacterium]